MNIALMSGQLLGLIGFLVCCIVILHAKDQTIAYGSLAGPLDSSGTSTVLSPRSDKPHHVYPKRYRDNRHAVNDERCGTI